MKKTKTVYMQIQLPLPTVWNKFMLYTYLKFGVTLKKFLLNIIIEQSLIRS